MREIFPGYYRPSKEEFETLWQSGVFVLDANVLMSPYRFSASSRAELFKVLDQIEGRIWIPFQAMLEFEVNRGKEIEAQFKKYDEVAAETRKLMGLIEGLKRRHSRIYEGLYVGAFEPACKNFVEQLPKVRGAHEQALEAADEVRDKINDLVGGKIGSPPSSQQEIDRTSKEAESRSERKIPPGFMDRSKTGFNTFGSMAIPKQHGDYFLWRQFLDHVKSEQIKFAILITGDAKEDWFERNRSGQVVGPHPNLIQEAIAEAGLKSFYIYHIENFLSIAADELKISVSSEAIREAAQNSFEPELLTFGEDYSEHENNAYARSKDFYIEKWLEKNNVGILQALDAVWVVSDPISDRIYALCRIVTQSPINDVQKGRISERIDQCLRRAAFAGFSPWLFFVDDNSKGGASDLFDLVPPGLGIRVTVASHSYGPEGAYLYGSDRFV